MIGIPTPGTRRPGTIALAALLPLALVGTSCRTHDFPDYPPNYREYAYVSNGGSNTVSIYDVLNVRVDREIPVGQNPTGITANPKRNEVYVVNTGITARVGQQSGAANANGSISIIDTTRNAVVATIPVHKQPYFLEVDPSGDWAYVANSGSNTVSVLDLNARREVAVAGTGEGPGLARIAPDGKSLVVSNRTGNSVSIYDVSTAAGSAPSLNLRKVITGCPGATDIAILPTSEKAFVACSGGAQVMAIALAHAADARSAARPDALEAMLEVGHSPVQLALKPDGGQVFVSNFDSDSISEIETFTDEVGGAYLMGSHPVRGLATPDNSLLFVSNFGSEELSLYSIDDGKRTRSIHVGEGPDALALSSGGNLLFVVDSHSADLAVIRTSSLATNSKAPAALFTLLPTGRQPNAIAIKAFKLP